MAFHHIWTTADFQLRPHLRRGAEARVAAHSAFWQAVARAVTSGVGRVGRSIALARRRRRNQAELSALSDRALDDIGLTRADIASLSQLAANEAAARTVAEFRRLQAEGPVSASAPDHVVPPAHRRQRGPAVDTIRRPEPAEAARAAAG